MKKSLRLEKQKNIKENIIKDVRNIFRLKKEIDGTTIKHIRSIFRLNKENEAIKDQVIRDIRNLFEHEETDKSNFWSNNYIFYESNGNKNKTLSSEEYLNKIRPYLNNTIPQTKPDQTS